MTLALNPQRAFGQGRGVIDLLAELAGQDRVVRALDYHDRCGDSFQFRNRVELRKRPTVAKLRTDFECLKSHLHSISAFKSTDCRIIAESWEQFDDGLRKIL